MVLFHCNHEEVRLVLVVFSRSLVAAVQAKGRSRESMMREFNSLIAAIEDARIVLPLDSFATACIDSNKGQ